MPMDMLAVLYRDGFDCQTLSGRYSRQRDRLTEHLKYGHPALTMLYKCLHWAVVSGIDDEGVWIADSIFTSANIQGHGRRNRTYHLSHDRFAHVCHGLILVSREDEPDDRRVNNMSFSDFIREYARGLAFGAKALGRTIPMHIRSRLRLG